MPHINAKAGEWVQIYDAATKKIANELAAEYSAKNGFPTKVERGDGAKENRVIKDLSDTALVEHYRSIKALAYNASQLKSRSLGRLLRELDITVTVARKRGVALSAT